MTDTIVADAALDAFLRRGFAELPYDPSHLARHIPVITDGMRRLAGDELAQRLMAERTIRHDEAGWKQEAGYVKRTDEEYKEFFHHQSPPVAWPDDPHLRAYAEFIDACGEMTRLAKAVALSFAADLEAAELLPDDGEIPLSSAIGRSNAVTRILRYPPLPAERGNHAEAYAHFDRSCMTIHWWASHEGLVIFDREGRMQRVHERAWDRIAVFPGKKFYGLTGGRFGNLGIHGVRDARGTGRSDDRFALVTFVHATLTEDAVALIHKRKGAFDAAENACPL